MRSTAGQDVVALVSTGHHHGNTDVVFIPRDRLGPRHDHLRHTEAPEAREMRDQIVQQAGE